MFASTEETIVLCPTNPIKKQPFMCDLMAFVFFMKGQCPSLREVEGEVKSVQMQKASKRNSELAGKREESNTSQAKVGVMDSSKKLRFPTSSSRISGGSNAAFTCYSSPVLSKTKKSKVGLSLSAKPQNCENASISGSLRKPLGGSKNCPAMASKSGKSDSLVKPVNTLPPQKSSLAQMKLNAQQQKTLASLSEVANAVINSSSCSAMLLGFGQGLLSITHAVMIEFVPEDSAGASRNSTSGSGSASAAAKLIFSQLMSLPNLSDTLPITNMHVLVKCSRNAPPAPFQAKPHFHLRPSCQVVRLSLPHPTAGKRSSTSASASAEPKWFHSTTAIPGYAFAD